MRVYELRADANKYQNLTVAKTEDWEHLRRLFSGKPLVDIDTWKQIKVKVIQDKMYRNRPPSDFPSLCSNVPIFSQRAVDALEDFLIGNGELLELNCLNCKEEKYYAFNVLCIVDALDFEQSKIIYFKNTNRILDVEKYAFRPDIVASLTIFKVKQLTLDWPFVTDKFVERVQAAKLKGFWFKLVWEVP